MKICMNTKIHTILRLIEQYITDDILNQCDNEGTSTLMYIVEHINGFSTELPKLCDTIEKYMESYINHTNINNDTVFTIAAKYSYENLRTLINFKNQENYIDYNKCFTYACQYESRSIDLLLDTKKINPKKCYGFINLDDTVCYANFLQIACRYNVDCVCRLLTSSLDLEPFINESIGTYNAFKIALIYHPESVTLLLNSKYGNIKMITDTDELCENNSAMVEAIAKQLASYVRITKSKHFNNSLIELPDYASLIQEVNTILSHEVSEKRLLKCSDIPCHDNNKNVCSTCFSNETRIIFVPCGHKCCVMCSVRLQQCPQCRAKITSKLIYN